MTLDDKVKAMGIDITDFTPSTTLAPATRIGNTIYVSGHVSTGFQGKLGPRLGRRNRQASRPRLRH